MGNLNEDAAVARLKQDIDNRRIAVGPEFHDMGFSGVLRPSRTAERKASRRQRYQILAVDVGVAVKT